MLIRRHFWQLLHFLKIPQIFHTYYNFEPNFNPKCILKNPPHLQNRGAAPAPDPLCPLPPIGVNFYKAARLEPPLFKLLGFRASEPPHFLSHAMPIMKLSSVVYRPNSKMTPNDIHANQTTSFVRIQQWKLQAVSRIVLEFFSTSRCLVA